MLCCSFIKSTNQVQDEDVEESDDEDDKDPVTQDEFSSTCKRCGEEINEYYRYYYKCIDDSCDFPLHKFCAEVPTTLTHTSHPLPLTLTNYSYYWTCGHCGDKHYPGEACYQCTYNCRVKFDVRCVLEGDKKIIHHPSHPHPLVHLISNPILCLCKACGRKHEGVFFLCTTCTNFAIHTDCAFLPKSLLIQKTSNDIFHHAHHLALSYSFPYEEQKYKFFPRCRVCDGVFFPDRVWELCNKRWLEKDNLWIYKCEKCLYYVHLDCATSRKEPFMSILSIGKGPTSFNYKDADYPDLLHLPFPDQTYSMLKHLFFKQIDHVIDHEVSLKHMNHQHDLVLVDSGRSTSSSNIMNSSLIMCHDPMKKIEVLCNVCVRPIMEMPFYKCSRANELDEINCNFVVHEWCTRLPTKVDKHPLHPQHTLILMSNVPRAFFNIFYCDACLLPCSGYAYGCVECEFYVDVSCGFLPEKITHNSHPHHLLSILVPPFLSKICLMCRIPMGTSYTPFKKCFTFGCSICDVYIHLNCAFLLPETIRHCYDKHPMHLSYLPIQNHKSEYFCEICESILNPHRCFYHCDECAQSVHSECAPLILFPEKETHNFFFSKGTYWFINVKFGNVQKIDGHPHPLSFAQGIATDGDCNMCGRGYVLQYKMIFKCDKCRFAIHYECCKRLSKA